MKKAEEGHYSNLIAIATNGYAKYKQDFEALYRMYRGEFEEDVKESLERRRKSSLYVNKAYALVQRLRASTEQAYFTNPSFASFSPLSIWTEDEAEKMQEAFDTYWNKRMKPYVQFSKTTISGYTYGTPVLKVYWANGKPVLEDVNIHDIYFDPSAKDSDDIRLLVNNIYMTEEDVAANKKLGIYNKRFSLSDIQSGNMQNEYRNNYLDLMQDGSSFGRVMLQDVYERLDGSWYLTTTYNRTTILRERVKLEDGLPFVIGKTVPAIDSNDGETVGVYSDSPLAPIYDLQKELNVRVNQEIDAIAEVLNPSFIAERNSGINEIDMRKGPSKVLYVSNLSSIQQYPVPNISQLSVNEERLRQDMEEITGIQMLGSADTSSIVNRQTAEGMNILSSEKSLRTDAYIRTFNESFVEPLIEKIARLIWTYSDDKNLFKGIDRSKDFDFNVSISAGLGATSLQSKLNGLDSAFQKFMALQDTTKAEQTVMDSLPLLGIKNTADYFEPKTNREKREDKVKEKEAIYERQQEQYELEKRKAIAELSKIETENAQKVAEISKDKAELEMQMKKLKEELSIAKEKLSIENRKIDIEEHKLLSSIKGDGDEQ